KLTHRRVSFGNPWTGIKQPRGFSKWREVDGDRLTSDRPDLVYRFPIEQRRLVITKKLELRVVRYSETKRSTRRTQCGDGGIEGAGIRIGRVESFCRFPQCVCIARSLSKN